MKFLWNGIFNLLFKYIYIQINNDDDCRSGSVSSDSSGGCSGSNDDEEG